MKRFFTIFAALMIALFVVGPAYAEYQDMWADVFSWDGGINGDGTLALTKITSGVTYQVLAVDADTEETLYVYNSDAMTALTNIVTTTNFNLSDRVQFRVDPTDASTDRYVDLIVVDTAGGYTTFVENFDKHTHSIIIDQRPNVLHHGIAFFAAATAETDTGIDLDYDTQILDVMLEVVTVDATETCDVGLLSSETSGDANGLRSLVSVATAGFPTDTAVITGGSNIDYTPVTTYGALLVTAITGSDAVATNGGKSFIGHTVTGANAKSITYTCSAGSDTSVGYIHYWFTRLR